MKSTALRSNAPISQKTAKRNIVRHPAELSNILALSHMFHLALAGSKYLFITQANFEDHITIC